MTFWSSHSLQLPAMARGWHLITDRIVTHLTELPRIKAGLLHLFLQHTSASIAINENADPDVTRDLQTMFDQFAPEDFPYRHTCEGPDDMPAHVKTALLGHDLTIPVADGRLALGTWQGIYLVEHRNHGGRRRIVLTLQGETHAF